MKVELENIANQENPYWKITLQNGEIAYSNGNDAIIKMINEAKERGEKVEFIEPTKFLKQYYKLIEILGGKNG